MTNRPTAPNRKSFPPPKQVVRTAVATGSLRRWSVYRKLLVDFGRRVGWASEGPPKRFTTHFDLFVWHSVFRMGAERSKIAGGKVDGRLLV